MWQVLLLAVCTAIAFDISTVLIKYYSPLFMIGSQSIISGILIMSLHHSTVRAVQNDIILYKKELLLAVFFGFVIPLMVSPILLDQLAPVDISIIGSTQPLLIYFFAYLFFGERLINKQLFFLCLGVFFSFAAIIIESGVERVSLISWREPILLIATMLLAFSWLTISRIVRRFKDIEDIEDVIAGLGFIATGIISLGLALSTEKIRFSLKLIPFGLFLLAMVLEHLIVIRMRAKFSRKYSQTLLGLLNIFSPFIVGLHEVIFNKHHYSWKFFGLLVPSLICFGIFYYLETNYNQAKSNP